MDLVSFAEFSHELNGLRRKTAERMSLRGDFPPFVRWSAYAEPLWSLAQVRAWIADKLSPLRDAA